MPDIEFSRCIAKIYMRSLSYNTFGGCSGFTGNLIIPDGVVEIGRDAFSYCNGLNGKLFIPDSVKSIHSNAFLGCSGLDSIIFGEGIEEIQSSAFSDCNNIKNIWFEGDKPTIKTDTFTNVISNAYYPSTLESWLNETLSSYGGDLNWIPYTAGTKPWLMDFSETAPKLWFIMNTDVSDLSYSYEAGYSAEQINLNVAICYIVSDDNTVSYEDVTVAVEIPQGFSFSADEEVNTITGSLGTINSTNMGSDISYPIYITGNSILDEIEIKAKVTAKDYETPQIYTYTIPITISSNKSENNIIDIVERYTSSQELKEVSEIINNSSISEEEKRQALFEYYNYDNMVDVRESIVALSDAFDERWSYIGLTTDDMYLAWQYYYYLNETPKGLAARTSLYASGLVFNGELGTWLDPGTYADGEYPGIEKYKECLEKFIHTHNTEIQYHSYIKEVENFVNSSVGIWSDVEKGEILRDLGKSTNIVEAKSVLNDFVAIKIPELEGKVITLKEKTPFTTAMNDVDNGFKIANVTMDAITSFLDISSNLATYETYNKFLEDIYDAYDLPWEMRMAAYQLNEELKTSYLEPLKVIFDAIRDKCMGWAFDMLGMKNILSLNGWIAAIDFTAFCTNQFADIGALVRESAYTEGYVMLALHYKDKLETCKQRFLINKTEKNAWAFYEAYEMLWQLRVAGENMYLNLNNMDGLLGEVISESCGYSDKKAAVDEMLITLDKFKFQYDISGTETPEEYQYLQKIVVQCPVSVKVSTESDEQICLLNDKEETEIINDYGRFVSLYRATTGDYTKIAYLNNDSTYKIEVIGQNIGKVNCSIAKTQDHQTCTIMGFHDTSIAENSVIKLATNQSSYVVDYDGDGLADIEAEQADKNKIFVQFDYQDGENIKVVYVDEGEMITLPNAPMRQGYEFLGWYTDVDGTGEEFNEHTKVKQIITVYAKWRELYKLNPPEADIESESVIEKGTKITLTCTESGASIYYTIDGLDPTIESICYTEPIEITADTVIKAIAVKEGFKNSEVVTFSYIVSDTESDEDISDDVLPEDIPASGIPEGLWISGIEEAGYVYSGKAIKPEVRVYDYKTRLVAGKDYTIGYKNNVKANNADNVRIAPTVVIKGKGNYVGSETAVFKIRPVDLSSDNIKTADIVTAFNKRVQKKIPTVTYNGKKLVNKKDFTVSYPAIAQGVKDAYKAPDTYDIVLTAKEGGNFTGTRTVKLTITDSTLISKVNVKKISNQTYSGTDITPVLTISYRKTFLTEGIDYTVTYENNINIGTATAVITGIGKYAGTRRVNFKITGKSLSKAKVIGIENKIYNGEEQVQQLTLSLNGKILEEKTDYVMTYNKNKNVGKAIITIKGVGAYTGSIKKVFQITAYDIKQDKEHMITDGDSNIQVKYVKGGCRPEVSMTFDGDKMVAGIDYTVSYKYNTAVTTSKTKKMPTIIIKGKGNYKGTLTKTFTINAKDLEDEQSVVTMTVADVAFVNKAGKYISKPVLTDADGKKLVAGKDYEKAVVYTLEDGTVLNKKSKVQAGTKVKVTVTGKGAYSGTKIAEYRITKSNFNKAKIKISAKTYTGSKIKLDNEDITVKVGNTTLMYGTDYEIVEDSYINNIKKGVAKVTIVGKGNYGGTKIVSFKIVSKHLSWFWRILSE